MCAVKIAIVGATGLVGRTFLKVIEELKLQNCEYTLMASANSVGKKLLFFGREYPVEQLTEKSISRGFDMALFSAGSEVSRKYAPIAAKTGCVVIDNSSAWRMDSAVPLVVPQVNPEDAFRNSGIIANPNCSTIQAVVPLYPLHRRYGLKRVIFSTYQSVSGAGAAGIADLESGIKNHIGSEVNRLSKFDRRIFSNCIPFIDSYHPDGYSNEEHKMVFETQKILHDNTIKITATCVRVPVFVGHCESVNVQLKKEYRLKDVVSALEETNGIVVMNNSEKGVYPTQFDCEGKNEVYVGRIRRDDSAPRSMNFWIAADNLRKGAAANAVEIAQLLLNK